MIEFEERTYTEEEFRALFKAIYEGKITHVVLYDFNSMIAFNIAPVVYCGECEHCRKSDGYCTRHHLKERDKKWFCGDGRKLAEGHHHDVKIEGGKVSA